MLMVKKYINNIINMALSLKKGWSLLVEMGVGQVHSSIQLGAVFCIYLVIIMDEITYKQKWHLHYAQIVPYDISHIGTNTKQAL